MLSTAEDKAKSKRSINSIYCWMCCNIFSIYYLESNHRTSWWNFLKMIFKNKRDKLKNEDNEVEYEEKNNWNCFNNRFNDHIWCHSVCL